MEFVKAETIDEALAAKAANAQAEFLAGGTDMMVEVNLAHHRPNGVVHVGGIDELQGIDSNRIGSAVTWATLEASPHQALAHLARTIGSPQIRAAGTIGGNIATASPAGDGLPWIAANDASIEVASLERGVRSIPWNEFFTGVKQTSLAPDEMILGVVLPDQVPERQHFAKIGVRNAMVISTVSCVVTRDDHGFRLAFGSVAPTVIRAPQAEQILNSGSQIDESTLDRVGRSGRRGGDSDNRSSVHRVVSPSRRRCSRQAARAEVSPVTITFTVNGEQRTVSGAGWESLLNVLHDDLGLPGSKGRL